MPKIENNHTIEIKPERFLNACTPEELYEVDLLIQQKRYQDKIEKLSQTAFPSLLLNDEYK